MRKQFGVHLPYVSVVLIGALLSFAAGCSKHASDETIAQDVQAKVTADPETKDSAVSVTAKDGKVTLRGTVKDQATQKKVEQIAHDEPGATGVDDETAVMSAGAAAAAADQAANTSAPAPAPVAPPPPQPIVVPAGTSLTVTVDQALSSKTSQAGQTFLATLARPVSLDGVTAIPKGFWCDWNGHHGKAERKNQRRRRIVPCSDEHYDSWAKLLDSDGHAGQHDKRKRKEDSGDDRRRGRGRRADWRNRRRRKRSRDWGAGGRGGRFGGRRDDREQADRDSGGNGADVHVV